MKIWFHIGYHCHIAKHIKIKIKHVIIPLMDYPWGPLINTLKHPIIPYIIPLITRLLDNYVLYAIIHYPRYDHIKIQILGLCQLEIIIIPISIIVILYCRLSVIDILPLLHYDYPIIDYQWDFINICGLKSQRILAALILIMATFCDMATTRFDDATRHVRRSKEPPYLPSQWQ